ncbi:hypothetical protein [Nocardia niwae]|uniref:hypothetical protein n=1 Tax=Nocardia niwae TaxID=626084 RepID=UPI000A5CC971|nr:hypothetical protein [Nocardia niwae]
MLAQVFEMIDQFAPELRARANQVIADIEQEGRALGPHAYLNRFIGRCDDLVFEWRERELQDYRLNGELMGVSFAARDAYYTLWFFATKVARDAERTQLAA